MYVNGRSKVVHRGPPAQYGANRLVHLKSSHPRAIWFLTRTLRERNKGRGFAEFGAHRAGTLTCSIDRGLSWL